MGLDRNFFWMVLLSKAPLGLGGWVDRWTDRRSSSDHGAYCVPGTTHLFLTCVSLNPHHAPPETYTGPLSRQLWGPLIPAFTHLFPDQILASSEFWLLLLVFSKSVGALALLKRSPTQQLMVGQEGARWASPTFHECHASSKGSISKYLTQVSN